MSTTGCPAPWSSKWISMSWPFSWPTVNLVMACLLDLGGVPASLRSQEACSISRSTPVRRGRYLVVVLGQGVAKGGARGDPELGERSVQVRADGAW